MASGVRLPSEGNQVVVAGITDDCNDIARVVDEVGGTLDRRQQLVCHVYGEPAAELGSQQRLPSFREQHRRRDDLKVSGETESKEPASRPRRTDRGRNDDVRIDNDAHTSLGGASGPNGPQLLGGHRHRGLVIKLLPRLRLLLGQSVQHSDAPDLEVAT